MPVTALRPARSRKSSPASTPTCSASSASASTTFFDLGGDSLLATRLVAAINTSLMPISVPACSRRAQWPSWRSVSVPAQVGLSRW
ncbi:acyl carrier protein [Mycobacterium timonense]|uniref:acyl carrier protein n=1 Tax=Mycobacterium timonense TaxID=701043 RepID=UPI0035A3A2E4